MASVIPKFYKKEKVDELAAESLYLMLLSSSHVPNANTQQYVSQVSSNEITDSGAVYVAGGIALTGKIGSYDSLNAFLDANDLSIGPNSTLNYRWGVLYKNTGNPATSPIRAHIDFLTNQIITNGTSTIQWNALGIVYYQ